VGLTTKAVKATVKNAGDLADKAIDKGPLDRLEDKVDDKRDKLERKAVKTVKKVL
jgi:hypothetical protein